MAESSANDLFIGAFGKLFYDTEQQRWLSTRRITSKGDGLHALGLPREYIASDVADEPSQAATPRRSHEAKLAIKDLQRAIPAFGLVTHPELEEDYAPEFRKKPESLVEGWKMGDLIAQTTVHQLGNRHQFSRIIALPTSDSGNLLKVFELRDARQGWGLSKYDAWLKTYELHDVDSVSFQADGRIRQICVARSQVNEPHSMLAVRTAKTITVILTQLLPAEFAQARRATLSRLKLEEVYTFGIEAFEGAEFIGMDFCPWFPSSFALVAESGKWLLATILPGQNRIEENDTLQGEVDPPDDVPEDKWHSVLWTSINSFVVCNRSHLKAFRRRGNNVMTINEDVIASQTKLTILDMRRSPIDDTGIFITTTRHILYLRGQQDVNNVQADITYSIILSWRHNRDPNDHSLRLILVEETSGLKLMLFSRATSLTTVYDLAMTEHEHPLPLTSLYPHPSDLITTGSPGGAQIVGSDIVILQADLRGRLTEADADLDEGSWLKLCLTEGYGFYQSFILSDDMSVRGQIAYAKLTNINQDQMSTDSLFVPAPIWSVCRSRPTKHSGSTIEENFIDDEAFAADKVAKATAPFRRLRQSSTLYNFSSRVEQHAEWTIPFDFAYNAIARHPTNTAASAEAIIYDLVGSFYAQTPGTTLCSIATLLPHNRAPERADMGLDVMSIVEAALTVADVNVEEEKIVEILGSPATLGFASIDDRVSLASVHKYLAERYRLPLDKQLAAAIGEDQDGLVDRIAWQITLACLCIRPKAEDEGIPNTQASISVPPVEASQAIPDSIPLDSQLAEILVDEVAGQPAEDHNPELIAAAAQQAENIDSVVSRLQRLTTLINPPTSQSNTIALTLNHWQLHSDPAVYSYEEKMASQTGTVNLEGSAMTAEVVQAVKKRKEKQAKKEVKRRKIAEKASQASQQSQTWTQDTAFASSQVLPNSSQFLSQQMVSSSQPVASQLNTASQAVPGRFSGRLNASRQGPRAKARRAGF